MHMRASRFWRREISGRPDLAFPRERISRAARYCAISIVGRARYLATAYAIRKKGERERINPPRASQKLTGTRAGMKKRRWPEGGGS